MIYQKFFLAIAITLVVAIGYLVIELQSLQTTIDRLAVQINQSQEESSLAQTEQQASQIQPTQLTTSTNKTSTIVLSNADLNSLAELISQRLAQSMPVNSSQATTTIDPVVIDTPEIKAIAMENASDIITPFIGAATRSQDWNEMGKRLAEIQDPALKIQTIGAILGAINNGELQPPSTGYPDYLYTLLNPQLPSN